jgi:hypothetical protein
MIKINGFIDAWEDNFFDESSSMNLALDVTVGNEFYKLHDLEKFDEDDGGYPFDKWEIWFTQNEEERSDKTAWIYLTNGHEDTNFMTEEQIQEAIKYVKDNRLDVKHGLVL